jgi:hypothetical protein
MILQPDPTMNTNKQELLDIINAVKWFRGDEPLTAEATLDIENLEDEWTVTH